MQVNRIDSLEAFFLAQDVPELHPLFQLPGEWPSAVEIFLPKRDEAQVALELGLEAAKRIKRQLV